MQFLEDLFARVQEIMGTTVSGELVFAQDDVIVNGMCTLALYSPDTNDVTIYPALMSSDDYEKITEAIFHEARHGYQQEVANDWYVMECIRTNQTTPLTFHPSSASPLTIDPARGYEPRHLYASDATAKEWYDNNWSPVPPALDDETATPEQQEAQYKRYLESPIEFDAFSFANQLDSRFVTNKKTLYSLSPPYQGSWNVPTKP